MNTSSFATRRPVVLTALLSFAGCAMCSGEHVEDECQWPSGAGASDPMPGPLDCRYTPGHFTITGSVVESDVVLALAWCGCPEAMCVDTGEVQDLQLTVDASFGTLLSSTLACGAATATIRPQAGVVEGDIRLTGQLVGRDKCYDPRTCPIDNRYHVSVTPEGVTVTVEP